MSDGICVKTTMIRQKRRVKKLTREQRNRIWEPTSENAGAGWEPKNPDPRQHDPIIYERGFDP